LSILAIVEDFKYFFFFSPACCWSF